MFFLGAGFSCTAGLPNTAQLLTEVHRLATEKQAWGISKNLGQRLADSYEFFYPTRGSGFQPEVVDFFSVLSSYLQIDGGGLPEAFSDRALLPDLRFAIAHVLSVGTKRVNSQLLAEPHELLDRMIQRGNIVITTNWDALVEKACQARDVPYRLSGTPQDGALIILKLHGSIDWVQRGHAKRKPVTSRHYVCLDDLENSSRTRRRSIKGADVLRVRIDRQGAAWQTIKGASLDPYMITMAPGKADSLGPLLELWSEAYRAISAADELEIAGYSMPYDDVEIRTLLRAGVWRGPTDPKVIVRNPAPDVHVRIREAVHHGMTSDYTSIASIV